MNTATDIDLEALYALGDEVEKHCEHSEHNTRPMLHGENMGLTYVSVGCCWDGQVFMFCNEFLQIAMIIGVCNRCNVPLMDHYKIIGPVL